MSKPIDTNPVADVPQNWTRGQIISPTGTDVGLSAKHGYNYQASKINEALTDIGILNDAFDGLEESISFDGIYDPETNKAATVSTVTSRVSSAIGALDVASAGGSGKYISAISETDGKIAATASDIASTYSATGTAPVNGRAVAEAIGALDVAAIAGSASKTLTSISETDGKISATFSDIAIGAGQVASGTLPVGRGGTGVTANPSMLVNLASTTAADVFAASPRPGVTGTLPIANGGTGATTAAAAWTALGGGAIGKKASLAASDIPAISITDKTTGTLPIDRGGTGKTTAAEAWTALGGGAIGKLASLSASNIPNLDASKITSGTLGADRIPSLAASKIGSGTLDAARIPDLNASKITAGTLAVARGGTGAGTASPYRVFAGPSSGTSAAAPSFRALVAADIPSLSITDKTTGTLTVARGGTGATTASPNRVFAGPSSGTSAAAPSFRALAAADIPNLAASKITSGTLAVARGGTGLTSSPYLLVNLSDQDSVNIFTANPRPGVTGTLPTRFGGTGNTSVDTKPTSGSTRMVTSGGLYSVLSTSCMVKNYTATINNIGGGATYHLQWTGKKLTGYALLGISSWGVQSGTNWEDITTLYISHSDSTGDIDVYLRNDGDGTRTNLTYFVTAIYVKTFV